MNMQPKQSPREFEPIWAIGARNPDQPMALTYSKERGFFEPITNKDAEPVIGSVLAWQYRCDDPAEDDEAFNSVKQLARIA